MTQTGARWFFVPVTVLQRLQRPIIANTIYYIAGVQHSLTIYYRMPVFVKKKSAYAYFDKWTKTLVNYERSKTKTKIFSVLLPKTIFT
jgi:hypothetical protein